MKILINQGLETIKFGDSVDQFVNQIGQPDFIEKIDDFEEEDSMAYIYDNPQLIGFFEGIDTKKLVILETKSPDMEIFGEKVFETDDISIIKLMKANGYEMLDSEMTEWGGKRISFDDANIDFYFEDEKLSTINWGKPI